MSKSLRQQEGYILIDHRNAPGVPREIVQGDDTPVVGAGATYESATYTCSHCHRIVIIEPKRTRERAYCAKCDHKICDWCGAVPECRPYNSVLDFLQSEAFKKEQNEKTPTPPTLSFQQT